MTATLKVILATTTVILATNKLISTTKKVDAITTKVILINYLFKYDKLKGSCSSDPNFKQVSKFKCVLFRLISS